MAATSNSSWWKVTVPAAEHRDTEEPEPEPKPRVNPGFAECGVEGAEVDQQEEGGGVVFFHNKAHTEPDSIV